MAILAFPPIRMTDQDIIAAFLTLNLISGDLKPVAIYIIPQTPNGSRGNSADIDTPPHHLHGPHCRIGPFMAVIAARAAALSATTELLS
jgi:hypothetical protein